MIFLKNMQCITHFAKHNSTNEKEEKNAHTRFFCCFCVDYENIQTLRIVLQLAMELKFQISRALVKRERKKKDNKYAQDTI